MPSMIRLRRVGRNKQSNFRVVVVDRQAPRDGAYIEAIGFYNPRSRPAELRLDLSRLDAWIASGAQMSDTVASLARKARRGGDRTVEIVPVGGRPKVETPTAAPAAKPGRSRSRAAARPAAAAPAPVAATAEVPEGAAEPVEGPAADAAAPAESLPDAPVEAGEVPEA